MTVRAQASYFRVYSGATTYVRWQSYYVNKSVTLSGASYEYFPFECSGVSETSAFGAQSMTVTMPATERARDVLQDALYSERLCEVKVYEFNGILGQDVPVSSQVLIVDFVGKIRKMSGSFTSIEIEIGIPLSPVGSQIPPRNYTSALVGSPMRI